MLDRTYLFFVLPLVLAIKAEESGTFFTVEENEFLLNEKVFLRIKGQSLFSCSQICARRSGCKGANFLREKAEEGICLLLSELQTEHLDLTQKWQGSFYLKKVGNH